MDEPGLARKSREEGGGRRRALWDQVGEQVSQGQDSSGQGESGHTRERR